MNLALIICLTVVGLIAGFVILFLAVSFLEKQHICDVVPATAERPLQSTPYFVAMNAAAQALGFIPVGGFVQDRNSRMYQACMTIWLAPDRQTLLRITGGKTAGAEIKRTWLTTFIEPDRIVETSDEVGMADLSGMTDRKFLLNAHLHELTSWHNDRLLAMNGTRRTFSVDQALTACSAIHQLRASRMEALGLARFVNRERTVWRHTLKGAWLGYSKGLLGQLAESEAQLHRVDKKRPGQA